MSEVAAESPLTASLWHRPLIAEDAKDRLAKRRANAAVALLRLGRAQKVWPILQHHADPRTRSYLIHRFRLLDVDPNQVLTQLDAQGEVSIGRALILILGEFSEQQLPSEERERLAPRLLDLYANDPDSGIHGALAWTLRQWGQEAELQRIDQAFATGSAFGSRRWYVNRQGQTLVIVPPPGEFVMGSPPWEAGREEGPDGEIERQHHVCIDHTFAIMTYTVTVAEFLRFRKEFYYRKTFSTELSCPINNVNWYEAAAYCNWLNEQEGIPQEQWCYLPNDQGEYAQGMRIVPDGLRRTGYRLPTEAEWECACRAGSITSRYYGQSQDLDNHYAWTAQNALGRGTVPVGRFKPNDLGLFDMLGNVMEWSHDVFRDPSRPVAGQPGDEPARPEVVGDQQRRTLMASTYMDFGSELRRSAAREVGVPPNARVINYSLRVTRTCLPQNGPEADMEVRNDQLRLLRGSPIVHSSARIRSGYRAVRYSPNFGFVVWGIRPARTMS